MLTVLEGIDINLQFFFSKLLDIICVLKPTYADLSNISQEKYGSRQAGLCWRGSLISLDWPGTLTQTIASSWPRLLSIFVQSKDMNRNQATIISKLDIIACNIRIFVFETKDMYGSGNVSTTQHSTEITPKTSNINQVSKKTTTFTIHQSTWGVLSRQPLPSTFCWSKVQTPRLIIIYDIPSMFLTSSPDLEAGNSRTSSRRGVSGGVEGHHWEYNLFLLQSTVHTVFTKMLSS